MTVYIGWCGFIAIRVRKVVWKLGFRVSDDLCFIGLEWFLWFLDAKDKNMEGLAAKEMKKSNDEAQTIKEQGKGF